MSSGPVDSMKPIAPASGLTLPIGLGLAVLPLLVDAPMWGVAGLLAASGWAYAAWRKEIDRRPPPPSLAGETFGPLDVALDWRTPAGDFPTARRGWRAVVTESDLWLLPVQPSKIFGDRDHVRVPRLDVVGCNLLSETELRLRFLDDEARAQEARLSHVPNAPALARLLGLQDDRGTRISDLGSLG